MGCDVASSSVALHGKVFTRSDKVCERVLFPIELAILVPAISALLAAANMRNGIDETAIDQTEATDGE